MCCTNGQIGGWEFTSNYLKGIGSENPDTMALYPGGTDIICSDRTKRTFYIAILRNDQNRVAGLTSAGWYEEKESNT
jgi:hypothetical protein